MESKLFIYTHIHDVKLLIKLFFIFSFLFIFLLVKTPVYADNLLQNSSFEDVSSGVPNLWTKNVTTATLSISTTAKTGSSSASINKTNNSTGLIYLYQDVDVDPTAFYALSGYALKNDPKFSWVILRISWRNASSEISKTDSPQLTSDSIDFQQLQISSVQPPTQTIKARIELAANIQTANPTNPALFDDINFSQVEAPTQPTSTPTLAPTATPTPTSTPTKTPSPTPTPIPTKIVVGFEDELASESGEALGTSSAQSPRTFETAKPEVKILEESENILQRVFIILGILTIITSAGIFIKQKWIKQ